ncbi:undecaprenyl-diphosphate phosphatase [Gilvimarinus agarilyticus]|uniref:undecaprenyl-diphosphate phosphatase n=1 Tax=unclassified Gilvimarinus TaxID=2642066 RepID=UPI001C089CEA|nr:MULTISPECIES: undecaprenyl-diphosphate phosphatase [unclassified Gilvimarinus]MBU2884192.1 undecaprenyl-diphosphate phosphatase [Gilvimarinus agarilyticus]MDO6569331.1 undecaprenyl-diphosphate phosphatase [Gilvimarinus sp. 2_MG-2023]MDO6747485.1 undecaprenyl-diphosphate phosphatase [Gilvimarinus sp. 1_MG-2023]
MQWFEVLVLSLIQGLTEFLPISSSAHLLLIPLFTQWQDQGLAFDIALHFGSLLAVVTYFRKDIFQLFIAWCKSFNGVHTSNSKLAWSIILATIPVGLVGLLAKSVIEEHLRTGVYMAYSLIVFGLLLGWADWRYAQAQKRQVKPVLTDEHSMTNRQVLIIALSQVLALIPGTSRSGITMTAGLMTGMTREASARFSFLLSIPVIALAAGLQTIELQAQPTETALFPLIVGTGLSAISAYACIHWFLALIKKYGLQPFVWYRLLLGGYLLYLYY